LKRKYFAEKTIPGRVKKVRKINSVRTGANAINISGLLSPKKLGNYKN